MWSSGVPQADYGTSLKLDSCSEKSPLSLVKSALHSRNLATDACLYMYVCVCVCMCVYVCVWICMCVYVFVCVCMYLYVCVCMWLLWWSVQRFTKGALVADQKWKGCHCFVFVLQIVLIEMCSCLAPCVCTQVWGLLLICIFPCNCISSIFHLVFVFQPVRACGWPEVWG